MNKIIEQNNKVDAGSAGQRLDVFVQNIFGISRNQVQKMIASGEVVVDSQKQKASYLLDANQTITLIKTKPQKIITKMPQIIYEDDDIFVIDKPAGITVHEAPGESEITVNEIFKDKFLPIDDGRAMIVHRLDKGTSGVMVLAKNPATAENLKAQFASRKVGKEYIALVSGRPEAGTIDMPLSRGASKAGEIIVSTLGKPSMTSFSIINKYKDFSLILALPKTGRTHQIRVHLAAIGHPIYGDIKYGSKVVGAPRIFLHAKKLTFTLPKTGKKVSFVSNTPAELEAILQHLTIE